MFPDYLKQIVDSRAVLETASLRLLILASDFTRIPRHKHGYARRCHGKLALDLDFKAENLLNLVNLTT
jgi:hypothetical protein